MIVRLAASITWICLALAVAGIAQAADGGRGDSQAITAAQLVKRFKAATGSTLRVDRRASYPGHYTALALAGSIANQGRYGRFVVFVVGPKTQAADVTDLLADGHTGVLGTPGPSTIYWESGSTIGGEQFWLAKKSYGANVVLWWYGSTRKIDRTFKRVHLALRRAVSA